MSLSARSVLPIGCPGNLLIFGESGDSGHPNNDGVVGQCDPLVERERSGLRSLEFRHLLCQHIALQSFVLALLSKGRFICLYLFARECLYVRFRLRKTLTLSYLCFGRLACVRVTDLGRKSLAVHLLVDDVRVLANLTTKLTERSF